jgi:predicted nucleic acid-binding protein
LTNSELLIIDKDELVWAAGLEKCRQSPRLSLADCFAVALAKSENALLITTDGELGKTRGVNVRHVKV